MEIDEDVDNDSSYLQTMQDKEDCKIINKVVSENAEAMEELGK